MPSAVKWCGDFADLERGLRKTDAVSAKVWVTHAHSVYFQFLPRTRPRSKTGTHALLSIKRPHLPSAMSHNSLHASSPELASTITPHETVTPVQEKQEKHTGKAGASWQANEQQVLPHNRFWIVFPGLMCCVFLAALDQVRSQLRLFPAAGGSLFATDHRCNCFTNHCRTSRPGQKLQLGWKASLLSSSLLGLIPILFLSSYLLAASALAPSYGKLSDLVGRKPILYFAISAFLVSGVTVTSPRLCAHLMNLR